MHGLYSIIRLHVGYGWNIYEKKQLFCKIIIYCQKKESLGVKTSCYDVNIFISNLSIIVIARSINIITC